MAQIDSKNYLYMAACVNKIKFLLNRGNNLEGICNTILDAMYDSQKDTSNINIHINESSYIDWESFYKPRNINKKLTSQPIQIDTIDDELMKHELERLKTTSKYPFKKTNEYIKELLVNQNEIHSSKLIADDYLFLLAILIYGNSYDACYSVKLLDTKTKINNITYREFNICRRTQ